MIDEETGGVRGAAALNQSLFEEWGSESFLFVLDEGGMGIQSQGDVLYAYPGVGEKGYYDIQLTLEVTGGHSSRPPKHTGIGIMADAIVALESKPYSPLLTQSISRWRLRPTLHTRPLPIPHPPQDPV